MENESLVSVTVVVDKESKGDLEGIADKLREKGFELEQSMDAIGLLTGKVSTTALNSLSTVPGVAIVEEERDDYRTQ